MFSIHEEGKTQLNKLLSHIMVIKWLCLLTISTTFILSGCSQPKRLSPLPIGAKILTFGDSLTYGTGADKGKSYPEILETLTQITAINGSIPGELSAEGLVRLPKALQKHQPDLLVLCHGGNDLLRKKSPATLKQNLIAMINTSRKYNVEVVMIGVPEAKLFGGIHPVYQQVAEQLDVPFESEALGMLLKDNQYKSDYVHLNNKGYHKLAQSIKQLLEREGAL